MRWTSFALIGAVSLLATLGGRGVYLQTLTWERESLTQDLCHLVANYLETSAVRSAYEGMQQGLARSAFPDACVSVIDQGRSFSPDCADSKARYQMTVCKVEGNRGIHAEISYPIVPWVTIPLGLGWLALWILTWAAVTGIGAAATAFSSRFTQALSARLFSETPKPKSDSLTARLAHWLAVRSGVLKGVKDQAERFEAKIKTYQEKMRNETLLRAQKEVEASKSKERLEEIARIRHNLNSPLSSLLAVQERFSGDELSRQALSSGIQKIYKMLDELSDQDAADAEMPGLTIVETVAAESVVLLSSKFAASKQVRIKVEYDPTALSPVSATPSGLMSVLDNLLENAFDASRPGGEIRLRITCADATCMIVVEDDGCGIPNEIAARLFEKGATFGKVNGTGYGLHHCKTVVESWKGTIAAESRPGQTRFTISLPRLQTGAGFVGLPERKRIWVIDDDPAVAESLDESGYEVVEAASTYKEGQALLKRSIPEAVTVLVDFRLDGGQYGTDLIAGHSALRQFCLCTNDFDNPEVVRKARQVGVRILPKPLCFLAERPLEIPAPTA